VPQDVDFALPFAARANPAADRARAHHLAWVRAHGLIRDEAALRRYAAWRLTDLAAYAYPDAAEDDLCLATDAVCLGFPLDDLFDGPLGRRPRQAARLATELAAIPYRPPGAAPRVDLPLTRAYADVWRRSAEGMSDAWRQRAAASYARFFRAYVREARNRALGVVPDEASYLALRREAVGTGPCFDLIERAGRFELPARAHGSRELALLTRCAGEIVFLCNDVHSLEREEAQGDPHNLVLIRRRRSGATRAAALAHVRALIAARARLFTALTARVAAAGPGGRDPAARYAAGLADWIAANQRWGTTTVRYAGGEPGRGVAADRHLSRLAPGAPAAATGPAPGH
jgi:hypothetical protein